MVNASKILTVSYGTYSCTLEGFDDPLSAMRSVTEYFRDLTSAHPNFGAEPPTLDEEALHRIAQRNSNHRVEAKVNKNGNGVVLRQVEEDQTHEAELSDEADLPNEAEPSLAAAEGLSPMAVSHADAAGATPADDIQDVDATQMDPATVDSVAEKLRRIRAAVARAHVEPQFSGAFAEDEHANELFRARSIDAAFDDADAEPGDDTEITPTPEVAVDEPAVETEDKAETLADINVVDAESGTAEPSPDAPEMEAEAAKVFERDESVADPVEENDDTLIAALIDGAALEGEVEGAEPGAEDTLIAEVSDTQEVSAEPVDAKVETDEAEAEGGEKDSAETTDETEVDANSQEQASEIEAVAEAEHPKADPLILDAAMAADADDQFEAEAQDQDAAQDLDIEGLTARLAAEDTLAIAPEAVDSESDDLETAPAEPVTPQVKRARIVKMSRTEFMARYVETSEADEAEDASEPTSDAVAEPELAMPDSDTIEALPDVTLEGIRASLGETGLSPEDEEDLISELVAAERDAADESAEASGEVAAEIIDETQSEAPIADEPVAEGVPDAVIEGAEIVEDGTDAKIPTPTREQISATLKAAVEPIANKTGDLSVDRLLLQADSELKDNDSSRRRSAIAHLKAAVAAVRADGGRARDDTAAEEARTMDRFRDDLARVVRPETDGEAVGEEAPRKAVTEATTEAKPVARVAEPAGTDAPRPRRKMPPLMLVSEQRIDKPAGRDPNAEPVRPRRVQSDDEIAGASGDAATDGQDDDSNVFGAAEDFSGYVAEAGAEGVQELLEASAAFGTIVEGQPFNSRPQIMQRMLRFVPEGTVTREEGLRAFGVLLREGRLIRIQRGQFVLPETSRFRNEQKSAAG